MGGGSQKGGGEKNPTEGILPSQGKKKKEAGSPGQGKQAAGARRGEEADREGGPSARKGRREALSGVRTRASRLAPGGGEECPVVCQGGHPAREGASRGGAEFACRTPSPVGQVPRGRRLGGKGEKGVEMGFPPLARALVEEAPGQPRAACFRLRSRDPAARPGSAEPCSARRTGPLVPGGQRLWAAKVRGA